MIWRRRSTTRSTTWTAVVGSLTEGERRADRDVDELAQAEAGIQQQAALVREQELVAHVGLGVERERVPARVHHGDGGAAPDVAPDGPGDLHPAAGAGGDCREAGNVDRVDHAGRTDADRHRHRARWRTHHVDDVAAARERDRQHGPRLVGDPLDEVLDPQEAAVPLAKRRKATRVAITSRATPVVERTGVNADGRGPAPTESR